jgi:hypothetical protein
METFGNQVKWFMQFQGIVQGPLSTTNLQTTLETIEHSHLEQTLVWRRGLNEWMKATTWKHEDHSQIQNSVVNQDTSHSLETLLTTPKKTKTAAAQNSPGAQEGAFYRVQVNFVDQPLMSLNELLNLVAKQEDISVIAIQDTKTSE